MQFWQYEIQELKKKHYSEIDAELKRHAEDVNRLEDKRIQMSKMYDAEIQKYLQALNLKDVRIQELKEAIKKALKMMQHPRLMQLVTRELNFDRFEYTLEQKLDAAKQEINLTEKEEKEVRDVGIVLCPQTLKEFYS